MSLGPVNQPNQNICRHSLLLHSQNPVLISLKVYQEKKNTVYTLNIITNYRIQRFQKYKNVEHKYAFQN